MAKKVFLSKFNIYNLLDAVKGEITTKDLEILLEKIDGKLKKHTNAKLFEYRGELYIEYDKPVEGAFGYTSTVLLFSDVAFILTYDDVRVIWLLYNKYAKLFDVDYVYLASKNKFVYIIVMERLRILDTDMLNDKKYRDIKLFIDKVDEFREEYGNHLNGQNIENLLNSLEPLKKEIKHKELLEQLEELKTVIKLYDDRIEIISDADLNELQSATEKVLAPLVELGLVRNGGVAHTCISPLSPKNLTSSSPTLPKYLYGSTLPPSRGQRMESI